MEFPAVVCMVAEPTIRRLDMLHLLTPYNVKDLRLSGHVIYVGKSSMEVVVRMESLDSTGKPLQTMMLGMTTLYSPVVYAYSNVDTQAASRWCAGMQSPSSRDPSAL